MSNGETWLGLCHNSSHSNSEPKVLLFFSTHLALDSSSQSLFNYSGVSSNMVQVRNEMGRCMIHWMVIEVLYYYILLLQALISSCELWYDIQRTSTCLIWRYAAMCTVCCIASCINALSYLSGPQRAYLSKCRRRHASCRLHETPFNWR